jgi:hypothetical protein
MATLDKHKFIVRTVSTNANFIHFVGSIDGLGIVDNEVWNFVYNEKREMANVTIKCTPIVLMEFQSPLAFGAGKNF